MAAPRNPVIVPERRDTSISCPKCGGTDFEGRRIQGTITRRCKNPECKNEWAGGYGMNPAMPDPRVPVAPEIYQPPLRININHKTGQTEEIRKRVDLTPDYRKGLPVPQEGEEDV